MSDTSQILVDPVHSATGAELSDSQWLANLEWRRSADVELVTSAQSGDRQMFARLLRSSGKKSLSLTRRRRRILLETLRSLWRAQRSDRTGADAGSLASSL